MNKKIVVVGSSNTDMIIKMARLPKPGETIIGGEFSIEAGGKGANQAVSAARAGANVTFIARVGSDMFGKQAIEGFIQDGIDVKYIIQDERAPSGVALIFVDERGENSIGVASGANAKLSPEDIENTKEIISNSDILLMQLETPIETVKNASMIAASSGVRVILNPAPAQALDEEILKCVSILTPNETEVELLTGVKIDQKKNIEEAADILLSQGIETVLITLGAKGVYVATSELREFVTGFEVEAADTTAAGDVFNGVLAVVLAENKPLVDSARFACAAAALACCKLGAQTSAPTRQEIEEFLTK